MDPDEALRRLEQALAGRLGPARLEADDSGGAIVFVRRDLLHLDADALNDRLAAWTVRQVQERLPGASAFVSFRHARPATLDDAELDHQESWLDLEPTLRLELEQPPPTEADLAAFARLVPVFFRVLEADGRPEGWRRIDEGNAE